MRHQIRSAALACAAILALAAGPAAQAPAAAPVPQAAKPSAAPQERAPAAREADSAAQPAPAEPADRDDGFHYSRPSLRIGQDYSLAEGETTGDVTTILGNASIEGRADGDVVVIGGSARVAATAVIEGALVVVGGSATIDQGASVGRDLVIIGGTLTAPAGFTSGGEHVVIGNAGISSLLGGLTPWLVRGMLWGRLIVPDLQWVWVVVGTFFFIYLLLSAIFNAPVRASADAIAARPLSVFLLGLLVLVLSVPALVILAASVIGLAVVPFALCALVIGGLIGKAGVARSLGRSLLHESEPESRIQSLRSVTIGLVILTLAYMVPILGFITWAMTGVLALGAAAAWFRTAVRREHPPRVRPAPPAPLGEPPAVQAVAAPVTAGEGAPDAGTQAYAAAPPAPPAPPGGDLSLYPRATFLDRVAAFVIDCILVAIVVELLDFSRHDGGFPLVLLAYHIAFWAWKGTTLGGIVCGLRVVRMQGSDLRFAEALVRGLASVLSIGALGIGCFWMLQDAERQMWHDKIAGTLVVKVPRHLVLP